MTAHYCPVIIFPDHRTGGWDNEITVIAPETITSLSRRLGTTSPTLPWLGTCWWFSKWTWLWSFVFMSCHLEDIVKSKVSGYILSRCRAKTSIIDVEDEVKFDGWMIMKGLKIWSSIFIHPHGWSGNDGNWTRHTQYKCILIIRAQNNIGKKAKEQVTT